jgi:hypothetical protein
LSFLFTNVLAGYIGFIVLEDICAYHMLISGYVDNNLLGTGKISKAAILGLQGGVWAKSEGYEVRPHHARLTFPV